MEDQRRTTRSRSRAAMDLEQRTTRSKKKSAKRDERRTTRVQKSAVAEVKEHSTVRRKLATTTFQKLEEAPPSTSGHKQKTSAEGDFKPRDEDNRSVYGSLANFDITPLATVLKFRRIFSKASIPSPLWPRALEWRPTGENRLFMNARDLYREIFKQRRTLQEEVKTQADFYNPVRTNKGLLCWWEYLKKTPNKNRDDDSNDESGGESIDPISGDLNYGWVGETMDFNTIGLKAELKGRNEMSVTGKDLKISRLRCKTGDCGAQPGEFRHFIVNYDQASLSINGIPIGMGRVAGPLPEFAVLEIDGSLLFWWGTVAALEFVPEQQSTTMDPKPSITDLQQSKNLGEDLAPVDRSKPSTVNDENLSEEGLEPVNRSKPNTVNPKVGASTLSIQPPPQISAIAGSRAGYQTSNWTDMFNTGPTGSGVTSGGSQISEAHSELFIWRTEYKRRIDFCTQLPSQTTDLDSTSDRPHRLRGYSNLEMDDIVLAIAALRFGTGSGHMEHCFGNSDLYAYTRQQPECGMACAGTSNSFVIPLFFDESSKYLKGEIESSIKPPPRSKQSFAEIQADHEPSAKLNLQSKPKLRHCMLAFARCDDNQEVVSIDFYDSKAQGEEKNLVRETARNLVRNSGWLPHERPAFGEERWMLSPRQAGETCGVHTILNAWSVMLNLQLNIGQSYRTDPTFYAEALRVINLGLDGRLDNLTIRAFLQAYQYAHPQRLEEIFENESRKEELNTGFLRRGTIRMNKTILDAEIRRMHEQEFEPESENVPSEPQPLDMWSIRLKEKLDRGLHQAKHSSSFKRVLNSGDALLDGHVHMAIASVWEALRRVGIEWAFGTVQTFRANRTKDTQMPGTEVVLEHRPLMIPLFFGSEMPPNPVRAKGAKRGAKTLPPIPIGHHLLAVLRKNPQDPQAVKAYLIDSSPNHLHPNVIRNAVDGLVRYTGWMGIDADGRPQPVTPNIQYTDYDSPRQESALSCGFNAIFNAWAIMLGLKIHPGKERRTNTTSKNFLEDGARIVRLALNGRMDLATIQMFLRTYGYSAEEADQVAVPPINTVALSETQLENIVQGLQQRRRAGATSLDTVDEPDDAVLDLVKQGIDEGKAREALRQSYGDLQQAREILNLALPASKMRPDTAAADREASVKVLVVVHGWGEGEARNALRLENGDINRAIKRLLSPTPLPNMRPDAAAVDLEDAVGEFVRQGNDEGKAREALRMSRGDLEQANEFLQLSSPSSDMSPDSASPASNTTQDSASPASHMTQDLAAAADLEAVLRKLVNDGFDASRSRRVLARCNGDALEAERQLMRESPR